jgi:regulator of protease activity HflC (stomatin/prohibitin superfamily)
MTQLLITVLVVALIGLFLRSRVRKVVVFEFERGLLYVDGAFKSVVEPGSRWIWSPSRVIMKVDIRPRVATVPGQEILTRDGIAVRVSLVAV